MYDLVLRVSEERRLRDGPRSDTHLERVRNGQGLTPLQLAAREGRLELFQHIVGRELPAGHPLRHLSRRFLEWTYGPLSCSLYDLSDVDTPDAHSALRMVVSSPDVEKASELLEAEPLRSLLESKWSSFAAAMFVVSAVWYLTYMGLFTAVAARQAGLGVSRPLPHKGPPWEAP
ncbi:transient receptor potential cation channel subfamily V member 3-like [Monodelphis domestica]|uniref:transient receptor potential cation channel subfamily V member 3-like n=1 Tax=Monodelphis domestica TaxID=13616 RepID=UPI0024E1AD3D|nr:transient receptor potential cation channel subfamily V member 3-like [Monodelphis domestica]